MITNNFLLTNRSIDKIESIISYGASDHENSKHYSDQMDIYKKFGTKKMSFNREENYKNAVIIYNPR